MKASRSLRDLDIAHVLHGYTNLKLHEHKGPMVIDSGEGIYVRDSSGRRYIEGLAGLWNVSLGFSEARLVQAATQQLQKLPYYHNFSHKSHDPQIALAEQLVAMAPVPMVKVYFANSGSEANDSAIKMIWYRSNALGQPHKKKILSRARAYHGVTIAAASLTGLANNHRSFDLPLPNFVHVGTPHYWREARAAETEEAFASRLAEELEAVILREGPETVAAFFGEPVMGAGGVVVPPRTYWEKIQAVLRKYDVLLIADEVICGFGRTGRMFGCETFNIHPDAIVLSKQLTSGYVPMSALLMNERFYAPVAEESGRVGVFGHGFTGGGHPLAAAVALETLKIMKERNLVEHAAHVGHCMLERLKALASHPLVGEVRGVGLIAAVELVLDKKTNKAGKTPGELGALVNACLTEQGVISRNMLDAVAFCPPLIITEAQVGDLVNAFSRALDEAASQLKIAL
ncbi:MAG: aminotransferase [Gammaproteobacteria bacterium]|nr:aminotransferase [Gammaproteobacteria bacterium]